MLTNVSFVKAEALGNDFVIIRSPFPNLDKSSVKLADRKLGIGCDQVIWLEGTNNVRFFNADGSESNTCINGTRAVALYLSKILKSNSVTINTKNGSIECFVENSISNANVTAKIPIKYTSYPIENEYSFEFDPIFIDIGNPHIIFFIKDNFLIKGNVETLYGKYPYNLSFVKLIDETTAYIQTYERGVGFTDACGSASLATVLSAKELGFEISVIRQKGGDLSFLKEKDYIHMKGKSSIVFEGNINLDIDLNFSKAKVVDMFFKDDETIIKAYFASNNFELIKTASVSGRVEQNLIGKIIKGHVYDDDNFIIFAKMNDSNKLEIVFDD